jgi:chromosome segregation and condensation protein ScpB
MLLDSPVKHLEETDCQEEVATQALSLHSKHRPAESFVEVVGARNVAKSPSLWDTTRCGARFAEISQNTVALEIEEFKKQEKAEDDVV